jgi:hypothetical protein
MTDDTSQGWFVLGWSAEVHHNPLADLYTATIRQHPHIQVTAGSRSEALSLLRKKIAEQVGSAPWGEEEVN